MNRRIVMKKFNIEDIEDLYMPITTETSEISVFNMIGKYAEDKGYNIEYFKKKCVGYKRNIGANPLEITDLEMQEGVMYYIHIRKEDELHLSIYYDDMDMGAIMGVPYYELYDLADVERFIDHPEGVEELLARVKELI